MDCPPVFETIFSVKTSQTVTFFEIINNFIPEILKQLQKFEKHQNEFVIRIF